MKKYIFFWKMLKKRRKVGFLKTLKNGRKTVLKSFWKKFFFYFFHVFFKRYKLSFREVPKNTSKKLSSFWKHFRTTFSNFPDLFPKGPIFGQPRKGVVSGPLVFWDPLFQFWTSFSAFEKATYHSITWCPSGGCFGPLFTGPSLDVF